ncbi:MAG TPA: UPF0262 family protein [Polyangiaceae bacterium]|nr:UPF0262 family protein [Polyangiaceae bacterium]
MSLDDIRLDETLWRGAPETRRAEWRLAIQELLEECSLSLPPGASVLHIELAPAETRLVFAASRERAQGLALALPHTALAPHLGGYVDVCRQMADEGVASARLEALDMAKKLAHDAAARAVALFLEPLAPDHVTCRRLFTLLLTLHVDTTRLAPYHLGHRRF